jgi:hypothetical protein
MYAQGIIHEQLANKKRKAEERIAKLKEAEYQNMR